MHVLVTGGAGFIGRHLVPALVADHHTVRVLDNLSAQIHGSSARVPFELSEAEVIVGDIRDADVVTEALAGADAIVHLAAETGVGQSMYELEHYVDVNDHGTAWLLASLIQRRQTVRVVLASSRAVYGEGLYNCARCGVVSPRPRVPDALHRAQWDPVCPNCTGTLVPVATREDAPLHPGSIYAATKLAQEHLSQIVANAYGLSVVILRFFNVYGPGQSLSNPYTGILSTFYARARSGKAIEVFEDGRESRDFVYVDDVVRAIRRSLLLSVDPGQAQVINVGTGTAISIAELAHATRQAGSWDVPIRVTGAYRVGDVRHAYADTERCKRLLGLDQPTPLHVGLRRWLAWADGSSTIDTTDQATNQLIKQGLFYRSRPL
jgi:dTDP-L-rhamnose 4-epimerase